MNDVFALPHPLNVFAKQTKVAVAILDEPLKWNGDETVRIVFLLAIKNGVLTWNTYTMYLLNSLITPNSNVK